MTGIRLSTSFSLSLVTTAALFGFLGVLISNGDVPDVVTAIPGIEFTPKIPDPEPDRTPPRKP